MTTISSLSIPIREEPWGWAFSPVVEPYWSNKIASPYDNEWGITIDRFSGKVTIIGSSDIENDDFPILDLTLHAVGQNSADVFMYLRQLKGWTAMETKTKMTELPLVVLSGPMISLRSIHETFLKRGATTTLTLNHA
ncbi:MAG: hypothetical protein R3C03_02945 [Pirellulaceae bacterium]